MLGRHVSFSPYVDNIIYNVLKICVIMNSPISASLAKVTIPSGRDTGKIVFYLKEVKKLSIQLVAATGPVIC